MIRVRAFLLTIMLMVGCGSSARIRTASPLQRFDALRGPLGRITSASGALADDLNALNREMRSMSVPRSRAAAVGLKRHAIRFYRAVGRMGNQVRRLAHLERRLAVKHYFFQVLQTLQWQYLEGVWLAQMSDLAWYDPLGLLSRDVVALNTRMGHARRAAQMATQSAWRAWRWRNAHRSQFRYVRVGNGVASSP